MGDTFQQNPEGFAQAVEKCREYDAVFTENTVTFTAEPAATSKNSAVLRESAPPPITTGTQVHTTAFVRG